MFTEPIEVLVFDGVLVVVTFAILLCVLFLRGDIPKRH
jgi:hypothetical protein